MIYDATIPIEHFSMICWVKTKTDEYSYKLQAKLSRLLKTNALKFRFWLQLQVSF